MKLVSVEIHGFRRFRTKQKLHVDCRLVALLGPNEAGKSSVLKALHSLNSNNTYSNKGPSQDISRDETFGPDHIVLEAKFLIEDSDLQAMREIEESHVARWYILKKRIDGSRFREFIPAISRNKKSRKAIVSLLHSLIDMQPNVAPPITPAEILYGTIKKLLDLIENYEEETFNADMISQIQTLSSSLPGDVEVMASLKEKLDAFINLERLEHPEERANRIINDRISKVLFFTQEDRDLNSSYDLNLFFSPKPSAALPKALQNLSSAAQLDLRAVFAAQQSGDEGKVETLISAANKVIASRMNAAWNQSLVHVRFRISGTMLSVLVGTEDSGYERIAERSDGLRQFVALFAFLSQENDSNSNDIILLIDEIETHLHYDAQADLVQMLAKQQFAKKVIYTTHSIGCLPEDLALGLRLVHPVDEVKSDIINKFWSQSAVGLSPVLVGMGASSMAFIPVRYCILVEGPSDMMLLPHILREANGLESLGFIVAPGLAEASDNQLKILHNQGSRVLYLVDGDAAGQAIEAKLTAAGIPKEKVLHLGRSASSSYVVEDFVEKQIYVNAINEELSRSGYEQKISVDDLGTTQRPNNVDLWCSERGYQMPKKVDVAYRILDQIEECKIVDPKRKGDLQIIYKKIDKLFKAEKLTNS